MSSPTVVETQTVGFATDIPSATQLVTSVVTPTSLSIVSGTTSRSSASSSSRPAQTFTVKAGSGGFKFEPQELTDVHVGDTVSFEFYPPDHSVARAEFGSACVPYESTGKGKVGFWSGIELVDTVEDLKYYNVTVNSTEPIFYYCAAPNSCTGHQMVGVINPNSTQTLDKQIIAAKDATFQVKPGDPIPGEGTPTPSSTPSSTPSTHGHSLSGGAIAGIVVGAVAFLAICAALFFYVGRTKSLKEAIKHREAAVQSPAPHGPDGYGHASPGYASPVPFSPNMHQAEAGGQPLPAYGQHNATDNHYYGYTPNQQSPMVEVKHELASPTPDQQTFTHELEAPVKR